MERCEFGGELSEDLLKYVKVVAGVVRHSSEALSRMRVR